MSWKCLLCGYVGEQESDSGASEAFHCCSWCVEECKDLHPREVSALIKLEEIQPYFSVWNYVRRGDSIEAVERNLGVEPQPAKVFPELQLFIGDIEDAANVQRLCELGIGCVVNLCPDALCQPEYLHLTSALSRAGIHQHLLVAEDRRNFDILAIAEHAYGAIHAALNSGSENNGVLIHCWGGVNRSAAVLVAYLVGKCGVPLFAAVDRVMRTRGRILTNQSFRTQLVRFCFKHGLNMEEYFVPSALMVASMQTVASHRVDMICSDAGNKRLKH